jgi:hypothetical protein
MGFLEIMAILGLIGVLDKEVHKAINPLPNRCKTCDKFHKEGECDQ